MGKVAVRHVLVVTALFSASMVAAVSASAQGPTCFGEPADIVAMVGVPTVGTDGDDVIVGTSGDDEIRGGAGDDRICGLGGDDRIWGNAGSDQLDGDSGADDLRGGVGHDVLVGGRGHDMLHGKSGNDTIAGAQGRDTILGGKGNDTLVGGSQNDEIVGGKGRDSLSGGKGDDTLAGGADRDTLRGGRGADVLAGGRGDDLLDGGRGPDTCTGGQGATADVSCLLGLKLTQVVQLNHRAGMSLAPPGDDRLFVIEQHQGISLYKDGELLATPFLDLSRQVSKGNEQGVLGLAFHPDFATNRRFFVNYTDRNGDTLVVEYLARASDPDRAAKTSARVVIEIPQPHRWHNAGMLEFGADGYLYIAVGDGGPGADPNNEAQDTGTLLGGILRIDVDGAQPYAVPSDNPFVDTDGADELWAYGLRNPWRFSFDTRTNRMYVTDVGQSAHEEINVVAADEAGVNYGWKILEGVGCFAPSSGCNPTGTELPTLDIPRSTGACSVIGGYVYRGANIPELDGHYFWSDFCTRALSTFSFAGGAATEQTEWLTVPNGATGLTQGVHDGGHDGAVGPGFVTAFGLDGSGELHVSTLGGSVYRIEPVR